MMTEMKKKYHVPPNENSWVPQSLVDEFPTARSSSFRTREIVIDRQPSLPEHIVRGDEGEELVRATDGEYILYVAEG